MELYILIALAIVIVILQVIILVRKSNGAQEEIIRRLDENTAHTTQEIQHTRMELSAGAADNHRAILQLLAGQQKELLNQVHQDSSQQNERLYHTLSDQSNKLNTTLTQVVGRLQESNEKKLDQMRMTVDEKLTSTLTQRLDSSFKTVGDQLKQVYQSLGEMKNLASGVSDLQRVLTNVKARGTWAEVQLGNILEQTLTPDQYAQNVSIKGNAEVVEYAVKIPSRDDSDQFIWLPIDSKFPQEDYIRLCDAAEKADKTALEEAAKALERTVKTEAAKIARLYIDVPKTTDFAILFLATEGLYAEVLRRPGLAEEIQNKHRIMICGPTTITAFLNTLRMGFRTIALDKRAADVWKVLGAAKTQYDNFEVVLAKARKKIDEAGNTLDDAQKRNRIIQKNLKSVEQLDPNEAQTLLGMDMVDVN